MNWNKFVNCLVEIAPDRAPTDEEVRESMLLAADDDDEREIISDYEDPRDALREIVEEPPSTALVSFMWEGMFASVAYIGLIESDGHGLLVQRDDTTPEEDFVILACLTTPHQPGALVRYLDEVASRLGCASLPMQITNFAPDLLPAAAVHRLYARVGWDNGGRLSVSGLLDQLDSPAALVRVRQALPAARSLRTTLARLEALHDHEHAVTGEDRRLLRDLHFALVYEERR